MTEKKYGIMVPIGAVHRDSLAMIHQPGYSPHTDYGAKLWPTSKADRDTAYVVVYDVVDVIDVDQLIRSHAALQYEVAELRRDADLYQRIKANASEQLFNPRAAQSDILPDMRTCWKLPTMICSGPVGGYIAFDEAVELLPKG